MLTVITVKLVPNGPEAPGMTPLEMSETVEYYEHLHATGVFGKPEHAVVRYMVGGHAAFASEVPGVPEKTPAPVSQDKTSSKKRSPRIPEPVRIDLSPDTVSN